KEEDVNFLKTALGEGVTDAKVRGVLSTKFLKEFHAKYGTIDDFLRNELDMTMDQIQAVRDALLVKIPVPRAVL
ncbi:hypothetical protein EDD11_005719, partial [Mortierella claussenii]